MIALAYLEIALVTATVGTAAWWLSRRFIAISRPSCGCSNCPAPKRSAHGKR